MATIKSFTSLEQSKKLMEILPIESADMNWHELPGTEPWVRAFPYVHSNGATEGICPCWSLSAMLNILPDIIHFDGHYWKFHLDKIGVYYINVDTYDTDTICSDSKSLVDACYEMIIKLYELKLI